MKPGRSRDVWPLLKSFYGLLAVFPALVALVGIVRSQMPKHNPDHEKLPALADVWFRRFDAGYDVSHWYTAETVGGRNN